MKHKGGPRWGGEEKRGAAASSRAARKENRESAGKRKSYSRELDGARSYDAAHLIQRGEGSSARGGEVGLSVAWRGFESPALMKG